MLFSAIRLLPKSSIELHLYCTTKIPIRKL
uniref:Uncharacterized protein n=1 Tax=Myoviridae sp. ctSGr1 TaxID=2827609 RepID=A0A8S5LR82_9CAUD|nr:MAG TPA: hypothetical protein [Myoviridae sp. ctSGr1]